MKKASMINSFCFCIILILFTACNKDRSKPDEAIFQYSIPEQISDGWETASLEEVSMDEPQIEKMMDAIIDNTGHRVHSIAIIKNGKLVFEEYFEGYRHGLNPRGSDGEWITYDRNEEQFLASVSKSVTSTLVGIAIDEGLINSVDDKVVDYFPDYEDFMTGEKADISIKHLLTMSSGLPFDEYSYPYGHPENGVTQLFNQADPIRWVLEQELDHTPGTTYWYNSGTTNVLAAIIEETAGYSLEEFMDNYLFEPLGIQNEDYLMELLPGGRSFVSGGFWMGPRELCKIGYLFLNDGSWNDQRIISSEWIQEAGQAHIITPSYISHSDSYGYQWWRKTFTVEEQTYNCFFALGWGEQSMLIFPEYDLIIQIFCGYYQSPGSSYPYSLIVDYILPSLAD